MEIMHANDTRTRLYRSRDGVFLGVVKGFANYFGLSIFWFRLVVFFLILFTGIWPGVFLYLIAALVMKLEPVLEPRTDAEREFYEAYVNSRSMALKRLKDKFNRLDDRVKRMEDHVTSREYTWDKKLDS
jgi:phage shock protein C